MFFYEILVLLIIVVADLTSKAAIVNALGVSNGSGTKVIELIPNALEFYYSENTGAGWGMLKGKTTLLIVLTALCMVAIVAYLAMNKKDNKAFRLGMVFVLAGGLGNLIDRICLNYVRDFVSFKLINFPIFNLADSFITIGGALLVIYVFFFAGKDLKKDINQANGESDASLSGTNADVDSNNSLDVVNAVTDGEENLAENAATETACLKDGVK